MCPLEYQHKKEENGALRWVWSKVCYHSGHPSRKSLPQPSRLLANVTLSPENGLGCVHFYTQDAPLSKWTSVRRDEETGRCESDGTLKGRRHAVVILKQTMCGWLHRFCFLAVILFSIPPTWSQRPSLHTHTHPRSSAEEFDITLIINHALPHAAQLAHESS